MGEFLRLLVSIPAAIGCAVWDRLHHARADALIAADRQRLIDLAEGE